MDPRFLTKAFAADQAVQWSEVLVRQFAAVGIGLLIAGIFRLTRQELSRETRSMMGTLVLLTLMIGMISSVIGDNVARAFSLVGALSIVRFRTVLEDTQDVAFVILAVGSGLAIGAGFLLAPLLMLPFVVAIVVGFRGQSGKSERFELMVKTVAGFELESALGVIRQECRAVRILGASTSRQGTATDARISAVGVGNERIFHLLERLRDIEGVIAVEISTG